MESAPYPLGPSRCEGGIRFALYAPDAQEVKIVFPEKRQTILLTQKTGEVWHLFLPLFDPQLNYYYLVDQVATLDPFSPLIASSHTWGKEWKGLSQVADLTFDWQGISSPGLAKEELILYEMHVRAFTKDGSAKVAHPGTFLGLIEKIPYLLDLGINAVELLPIHEFDELETAPRTNFWGYSPISFLALMNRYGVKNTALEFKQLVRELHRAGIEVIIDVVYNHTSMKEKSPLFHLAKEAYYIIEDGIFNNETGCGNTVRCDHVVTEELILRSLRFLAHEYHVDGFRFDLATILKRASSSLIQAISEDPVLMNCKLIAEPWDPVRYEVGRFYPKSPRWSEWNDKFRDTVRQFIRGDSDKKGEFATRLAGSQDLYGGWGSPASSLNFITAHDGFTLRDLVSYNVKHNQDNGEGNRDGTPHNYSWNCGQEGLTDNLAIEELRLRQMKNFLLALFISKGIPMLHMGDEYGHTKLGNNNSWCQDNLISWFQWDVKSPLYPYVKALIHLRKTFKFLTDNTFLTPGDIDWHGTHPFQPRWDIDDHFLAFTLYNTLYAAFNASGHFQTITLPPGEWSLHLASSTPALTPEIIMEPHSSLLFIKKREGFDTLG